MKVAYNEIVLFYFADGTCVICASGIISEENDFNCVKKDRYVMFRKKDLHVNNPALVFIS